VIDNPGEGESEAKRDPKLEAELERNMGEDEEESQPRVTRGLRTKICALSCVA